MTASKPGPKSTPAASSTQPAIAQNSSPQLDAAVEGTDALLRGLETMRRINDRAVQSALLRFTRAAESCASPRQPLELLALPGELMRTQCEEAASYWQEFSGAALEMQAELLGCSGRLVDTDAVLQTASALEALPALPFFPTWAGQRR